MKKALADNLVIFTSGKGQHMECRFLNEEKTMFWNNAQAVNRSARTLASAICEKTGEELKHADVLDIIARLQGFPNHMAANAALEQREKGATAFDVCTWGDLWQVIATMSEEERKRPIKVSDGCDGNGNATFQLALQLLKAKDSSIESAADVLNPQDHVLLFEEAEEAREEGAERLYGNYPGLPGDIPLGLSMRSATFLAVSAERFANQCDLMEIMSYDGARAEYLNFPDYWEQHVWTLGLEEIDWKPLTGDYVIVLDKEEGGGYYCDGFGWTIGRETASGFDSEEDALLFLANLAEYLDSGPKKRAQFKVIHAPGFANQYTRYED